MGRRAAAICLFLFIAAGLLASGFVFWAYANFQRPGPSSTEVTLVLPRGAGVKQISSRLHEGGVIANSWLFALGVRFYDNQGSLKAGEYKVPAGASMHQVMDLLVSGKTVVRRLTIAEGLTALQVRRILEETEGLDGALKVMPVDGELLPETYHFSYGDSRQDLVERMRQALRGTLSELWAARRADLPFDTPEQALVLASIVEKETALAHERPHIAGVFLNRLRRGMRLQSDPTVVYAITGGQETLDRPLTRDDLKIDSPFNTYRSDGLPPAPICNPGRASIAAVLMPMQTNDLYFVADGTGGHAFAPNLKEHLRNVRRWRQYQRTNGANGG
jgi:UPF0755 protein